MCLMISTFVYYKKNKEVQCENLSNLYFPPRGGIDPPCLYLDLIERPQRLLQEGHDPIIQKYVILKAKQKSCPEKHPDWQ